MTNLEELVKNNKNNDNFSQYDEYSNYDHQEEMDEDDDIPDDNNDPLIKTTNVELDKTDKLLNVVENIGQRIFSLEDSLHSSKNNNKPSRMDSWGSPSNQ